MRPHRNLSLLALLLLACITSQAQELKPLSESEVDADYRQDKLKGTLKEWTKAEVKAFKKECEGQVKGQVAEPKAFCVCAQAVVAANLNYGTFMGQSGYQRGRALGYLTREICK